MRSSLVLATATLIWRLSVAEDVITIHAARRGEESENLYIRLGGETYPWWELTDLHTELPEPTVPVRITLADPGDGIQTRALAAAEKLLDEADRIQPSAGLSTDQHIRAIAAQLYWNGSPGTWTLTDIVAWISDGLIPDAAA